MRAVVQRVISSQVTVDTQVTGKIENGLCVLLGVSCDDKEGDISWMAEKITNLRIFEDEEGKLNKSLLDVGGKMLAISQFTLYGDCKKGRRPSFIEAARPEMAKSFYEKFIDEVEAKGVEVRRGVFQAHMVVTIVNDGPVTLVLDSRL